MSTTKNERRGVDSSLLRVIVDQFVARPSHPAAAVDEFEKLALGLIDALDAESVASAAPALFAHPDVPQSVVAGLLEKGGSATQIAFEFAPSIHAAVMLATAEHGPPELAAAIARRADLERRLVSALASRVENDVLRSLAANRKAHLDHGARRRLVQAGRDDLRLARILLDRSDLKLDHEPLFLAATASERAHMVVEACREALASNAVDAPPPTRARLAEDIEDRALRGDRDGLTDLLADALDCRKNRIRAILADERGEALALALLVLRIPTEAAIRIFLCFGHPTISHDVGRIRSLAALMRSAPPRAAFRLVSAITGSMLYERKSARRSPPHEGNTTRAASRQPSDGRERARARP